MDIGKHSKLDIEELTWLEARKVIPNPQLVNLIDEISPDSHFKLFKVRYPYGKQIIDNNLAYLPLKGGGVISFNDPSLPKSVKDHLSYDPQTSNPVGIVLSKHSEFYLTIENRIMPYAIVKPGHLFGLSRILDAATKTKHYNQVSFFMWQLTSGARSLFMLPKITNQAGHANLKRLYALDTQKPKDFDTHFHLFNELSTKANLNWYSEFIFFSRHFFDRLNDPSYIHLYNHFLKQNRREHAFGANTLSWNIVFTSIENRKNLKFSSYTLNTAKHLMSIGAGAMPGFVPATDDEIAPISWLQEVYVKQYGLNDYYPILAHMDYLLRNENKPVYYSLNHPTLPQYAPQTFKGRSVIQLIDEIAYVIDKYHEGIKENALGLTTTLADVTEHIDFNYYHNEPNDHNTRIQPSIEIPNQDQRFLMPDLINHEFPKNSTFFNGCIKLTPKKES